MGSKKVKTTSNETATTTPNVPVVAQGPTNDYYSRVGNFMSGDPNEWFAPLNSIQQSAFNGAGLLGNDYTTNKAFINAIGDTSSAISDLQHNTRNPTATVARGPTPLNTTDVAGIGPRNVSQAALGSLGPAAMASAANAGNASQVALQGYDPSSVNTRGYDASLVGDVGRFLDGSVERVNGQSLLDNFSAYMNPATQNLVDATLAEYDDNTGQQRAGLARRGAMAGGFGGSGYGLAQGQFEADAGRNRALTDAELRYGAFNTAAGLSNLDAARRQEAGMFNAGAQNERDMFRGQLGMQGDLANQSAINQARQFGADAYNQGQFFNADTANQAARYGADAYNRGQEFNAGANNDFALQNAGFQQQANLQNANAQNQFGLERFGAENALNLANMGAQNDAFGQQYAMEGANAQQNAAARNAMLSQIYGTQADMSMFNAGQANDMAQFGAQQDLARIAQRLAGAGQLGDLASAYSGDQRANLDLQSDIGNQLYQLESQRSPLGQLATAGGLLDPELLRVLTGQTINSSGTSTQKQSGGLLGGVLGLASLLPMDKIFK